MLASTRSLKGGLRHALAAPQGAELVHHVCEPLFAPHGIVERRPRGHQRPALLAFDAFR
jgi:hypothetical protein